MYEDREEKLYRMAQRRVKKKKGFYKHLQAYVIVNVALFLLTMADSGHYDAFPLPLVWGIGLAFHYANVFGLPGGRLTDEWEDRETEKELRKLKNRYGESHPELPAERRGEEFDLDRHLDLREREKRGNYREDDFV